MTALEALAQAQRAWEATQPQLFFELEDAGLDQAQGRSCEAGPRHGHGSLRLIEPERLTSGAEPCWDLLRADGKSFAFPAPPATPPAGGSAPLYNQTAAGRVLPDGTSDLRQRRSF